MERDVERETDLLKVAAQSMLDAVNGWLDIIVKANAAIDNPDELKPLRRASAQLGASLALPARICATSPQTMPEAAERMLAWGAMMERVMAGCWLVLTIDSSEELKQAPLPTLDEVLSCLPEQDIEKVSSRIDLSIIDQA